MAASRTLSFVATECGSMNRGGVLFCGASNAKAEDDENHSVVFIEDDHGPPYFELDDQSQGNFGSVKHLVISDDAITIKLVKGEKNSTPYSTINVDLRQCEPKQVALLAQALPKVFRRHPEALEPRPAAKPRARKSSRGRAR